MSGVNWKTSRPSSPEFGDAYYDFTNGIGWVWTGTCWTRFTGDPESDFKAPTADQLEKHPALKEAWEEFLIVKKLIGV